MIKNSLAAICFLGLVACGTQEDTQDNNQGVLAPDTIEIAGEYCSNFGDTQTVTEDSWRSVGESYDSSYEIMSYSNEDNHAITQNPEDAEWDPLKFNLIVWTEPVDGAFYMCWAGTGFDAIEMINFDQIEFDSSNPEEGGCGGFPWTRLSLDCEAG